ncbi:unnamed protein product [Protopolystoma xenopodis]|uniref:Uncharacterized protein n=1 Tax=Protopolystoma xenopodis TaxID=117903 RepID=A0A3S5A9G2_9PLAT|nr:unnamed protein product [Protopolystoma xenopodis]
MPILKASPCQQISTTVYSACLHTHTLSVDACLAPAFLSACPNLLHVVCSPLLPSIAAHSHPDNKNFEDYGVSGGTICLHHDGMTKTSPLPPVAKRNRKPNSQTPVRSLHKQYFLPRWDA